MPERLSDDRIELAQLPAGDYVFSGTPSVKWDLHRQRRQEHEYRMLRDVARGISYISTRPTNPTGADEFKYATLRLHVVDFDGAPVSVATLYVRDRMSEAWQQVRPNHLE
ncbi:MAG: hypothetical protein U0V70_13345 [Terriglobia bacterium]